MSWPTLGDLETYVQQDLLNAAGQADQALAFAIAAVEAHCQQPLLFGRSTVTVPIRGGQIVLPRFPVAALVSVTENGTTIELDRFYLNGAAGILHFADGWWGGGVGYGYQRLVVTFDAGFVVIPDDVRWIVLRVASRIVQNPTQVTDESYQGYSNSYGNSSPRILTDDERRTLDRFRGPNIA